LVCLDREGDLLGSAEFAKAISGFRDRGAPGLAFLVGGAEGLAPEVLARADLKLSLGPLTLPHGLARIVLAEQLYRAATILAGHPYHRA
jgi:23S rRNA (pseudouridine1915-N3)-methyltransferase